MDHLDCGSSSGSSERSSGEGSSYDESSEEPESSVSEMPDSSAVHTIDEIENNRTSKRAIKWRWNNEVPDAQPQLNANFEQVSVMDAESGAFQISGDTIMLFNKLRSINRNGCKPLDGKNDEVVYSEKIAVGPYSFLDSHAEYDEKAPPPVYFEFEDLNSEKPTKKDDVLQSFTVNKNGCLECTDEKIIEANQGVIPYVVKQMAKNMFTGQSVVAISLPVRIFQPKSLLERILDAFSFVPTFMKKACNTKDAVERMKYAVAFLISGMYMSADLRKPFNPILGETLEGYFKDGSRIYMEHISHHPPISCYLIEGPAEYNYRLYGSVEFKGGIKSAGNLLNISFQGKNFIELPDGHIIEFHFPTTRVSGLMWGERTVNMEGNCVMIDHKKNHKAVIVFNPPKPKFDTTVGPTCFEGQIFK